MYDERLIEHFRNPRNVGELAAPAITVEAVNPACGDLLRLSVRFEGGVITETRYQARGCTASVAAGSALTEWLAGKTRSQAAALTSGVIDNQLGGLRPESKHAAVLCVDAVKVLLKASGPVA